LADIEESNMSAEQIRQLLNIPNKSSKQRASSAAAAVPNPLMQTQARQQQQQQQQVGRQQQQQQQHQQARPGSSSSSSSRSMSPDTLQAAARQLGQLSPELAQEWYDRAVRQGLEQVGTWLTVAVQCGMVVMYCR
jgi:type II secretory pathway pseudopilin PulG